MKKFPYLIIWLISTLIMSCDDEIENLAIGIQPSVVSIMGIVNYHHIGSRFIDVSIWVYDDDGTIDNAEVLFDDIALMYDTNSLSYHFPEGPPVIRFPGHLATLRVSARGEERTMTATIPTPPNVTAPNHNARLSPDENIPVIWEIGGYAEHYALMVQDANSREILYYIALDGSSTFHMVPSSVLREGRMDISVVSLNGSDRLPELDKNPFETFGFWARSGDGVQVALQN
ncbi:MAG: hypothetical protein B6244_01640 [Candidatus Cloacimonetes bacterium 4572_55]|nr:MAG: hypothetical protein B6244_01640 [Candidatus Cloacimonetes bacterium 4572_55]